MTRIYPAPGSGLPQLRVVCCGRRWMRLLDVVWNQPEMRYVYDVSQDVHEQVVEEVRPGVPAEWTDPRERLGL